MMVALFKRGPPREIPAYRLIMVKQQHGLLQEGILSRRLAARVRESLEDGESGYVRGVEDPHLLMHEAWAMAFAQNRKVWVMMGDFKSAFPTT